MQPKTIGNDLEVLEFVVVEPVPVWALAPVEAAPPSDMVVRGTLTALLGMPLRSFGIVDQVGRFALVEYHPVEKPDPDIMVMVGRMQRLFNSQMLRLQEARAIRITSNRQDWYMVMSPQDWYRMISELVADLAASLVAVEATPAEAVFVMEWAAGVRDFGRSI